jgi:hypothetical protein
VPDIKKKGRLQVSLQKLAGTISARLLWVARLLTFKGRKDGHIDKKDTLGGHRVRVCFDKRFWTEKASVTFFCCVNLLRYAPFLRRHFFFA